MYNTHFVIVVPVWNAAQWIEKCLDSIYSQTYRNFEVIIINDGSTDGTSEILKNYKTTVRTTITGNYTNIGSGLASIATGIRMATGEPNDVIVTVDGDDWLSGDDVLSTLAEVYADPNILMTYGQFEPADHSYHDLCQQVRDSQLYRYGGEWIASHLRTFRRSLWDRIDDSDLRDHSGNYFKVAWDGAFIFPMIEMCGLGRLKFISKVLYIYNNLNPTNDMKIRKDEQIRTAEYIRSKPRYPEIR